MPPLAPVTVQTETMTRGTKTAATVLAAALAVVYGLALLDRTAALIVAFPLLGATIALSGAWLVADVAWLVAPRAVHRCFAAHRGRFRASIAVLILSSVGALWLAARLEFDHSGSPSPNRTLESLPYLDAVPVDSGDRRVGVTRFLPDRASPGFNLFSLRASSMTYLMDLRGRFAHTWSLGEHVPLHHAVLTTDGGLVAGMYQGPLFRIDRESHLIWRRDIRFHHHICVDRAGHVHALGSEERTAWWRGMPVPILDDVVVELSPAGKVLGHTRLFSILSRHVPLTAVLRLYVHMLHPGRAAEAAGNAAAGMFVCRENTPFDILHTNTVEVIDEVVEGVAQPGDLLVSPRELDLIAVVDPGERAVRWSWGPGEISRQHQPTLLANGHILLLDNGRAAGRSRVVELDPISREIAWQYEATPPESFFTPVGGGVQRLPNGDTLITAEYEGHVFEVTPEGQVVWEFFTPRTTDGDRASIYRMERIPFERWIDLNEVATQ